MIETLSGSLGFCFERCALVGSSADMLGRTQGQEIDAHDTVIRVNRLPSAEYYDDFGKKTDIYFAEPGMRMLKVDGYATTFLGGKNFGGSESKCLFASGKMEGDLSPLEESDDEDVDCPFASIVFKGTDAEQYGLSWKSRFPEDEPGWNVTKSSIPMGYQSSGVNSAAGLFSGLEHAEPTSGFQALLTFAPICSSLTVYGFTGTSTSDQHAISEKHDMVIEHYWESRLQRGSVPGQLSEPKFGRENATASFNWLANQLAALVAEGAFEIVKG